MRNRIVVWHFLLLVAVLVVSHGSIAQAQTASQLVGSWERFSLRNAEGAVIQPPEPAAFMILTGEGYFSVTAIPTDRKKIDKPLDQLTREELLNWLQHVNVRRGTYTVSGNTLTRKDVSNINPNQEGRESVQQFRLEGDVLIFTNPDPKNKAEAQWRRVK